MKQFWNANKEVAFWRCNPLFVIMQVKRKIPSLGCQKHFTILILMAESYTLVQSSIAFHILTEYFDV